MTHARLVLHFVQAQWENTATAGIVRYRRACERIERETGKPVERWF